MGGEEPQNEGQWRWAREQRMQSLRELAQQGQSTAGNEATTPSAPAPSRTTMGPGFSLAPRRRPRWGRIVLAGAAMTVLVLAGVGAYLHAQQSSGHAGHTPYRPPNTVLTKGFRPLQDGISCVKNVVWSPDNIHIAVFGYASSSQGACPPQSNIFPLAVSGDTPTVIGIYDASGKLMSRIQPDTAIRSALGLPTPAALGASQAPMVRVHFVPVHSTGQRRYVAGAPFGRGVQPGMITYGEIGWSPDGKQLALIFFAVGATDPQLTYIRGVLLADTTSAGKTQVYSRSLVETSDSSGASPWDVWNVRTGKVNAPTASSNTALVSLGFVSSALGTLAGSYQWDTSGHLIPGAALSDSSTAVASPVGNPVGGAAFSIWQAGQVTLVPPYTGSVAAQPEYQNGIPVISTSFLAWSPDGQYVALVEAQFVLRPSGQPMPTQQTLQAIGMPQAPVVAVRDTALANLLNSNVLATIQSNSLPLAWSPNGRLLIAPGQGSGQSAGTLDHLTIYECATGKELETLAPSTGNTGLGTMSAYLRWSPDGSHLLYYDSASGVLSTWKSSQS